MGCILPGTDESGHPRRWGYFGNRQDYEGVIDSSSDNGGNREPATRLEESNEVGGADRVLEPGEYWIGRSQLGLDNNRSVR